MSRRSRSYRAALGIATVLAACGCVRTADRQTTDAVTTIDSAGIIIVDNGVLGFPPAAGTWLIDSLPEVLIGAGDRAGSESEFHAVSGLALMPDGMMIVADWRAREVRLFARDGRFDRVVVRAGGGPGELYEPYRVYHSAHDTVVVTGKEDGSLLVLGPDLQHVRTVRAKSLDAAAGEVISPRALRAVFDDGTALAVADFNRRRPGADRGEASVVTDSSYLVRERIGTERLAAIGWKTTSRGIVWTEGRGFGAIGSFHGQGFVSVRGTNTYHADGARLEIQVHDGRGALTRIIRASAPVPRVEDALRRAMSSLPRAVPATGGAIALQDGGRPSSLVPDSYPPVRGLHVDREGNVWVSTRLGTAAPGDPYWLVFDTAGVLRHAVPDPTGLEAPLEIVGDRIIGVSRDADRVERVAVHRIRR